MILHVACLPFPTHQGTQAAIAAMLKAETELGRSTHLLTYAYGAYGTNAPYAVHRIPDFPKVRSLRSGPSWGKIALDARCIAETRKLHAQLRPRAIVAHHIEAAIAALVANVGPVYYVAHTSLSQELPIYFPGLPTRAVSAIGGAAERLVCGRAQGVAAVAPSLAALLGAEAHYLPVPWTTSPQPRSRRSARTTLGLPQEARICLYAGNLDRYQGWETLIDALRALRRGYPEARLLIATQSDPAPAKKQAARRGVADFVDVRPLHGEPARVAAHAASDVAWIPRRTEGGLPIKMLDAFGRGVPVVAMKRATAGLSIDVACRTVANDDARAIATATAELLSTRDAGRTLAEEGARYLASAHDGEAYVKSLDRLLGHASGAEATQRAPRPRAEPEFRAR